MMAFRPMVGIAIGVVITLFIAAGILVGVYRCRVNPKRDKGEQADNLRNRNRHSPPIPDPTSELGPLEIPLSFID